MKLRHCIIAIAFAAIASQADISYSPVTTGATESAQKLYNFLATNYGNRTVSGIQTGELSFTDSLSKQPDPQAVFTASGKYPALVGFDFLFATGKKASDSWYKQYTDKAISLAIELWKNGGIPAFSWHWKDPSDSVDAFYVPGAGNATDPHTTFNFTKAFKTGTTDWDTTSVTYTQIVSDIDEIAALFKKLQDAGAAAIFRPLHECSGNWFWWNTQSPAQYAALYRLVYTRMTQTDNIKNLIWVWNPQTTIFTQSGWNPGPTYYDVIGVDIYNNAYDYESNASAFTGMKSNYGTDKMFALSENGPIPDASLMHADNTIWSWYMPWYESWSGNFVSKTKNTVWKANLAAPCVYTLDKMPGWSNYTISTTKVAPCDVGYKLGDLDTAVEVKTVTPDTSNGNGWLKVVCSKMTNVINTSGDTTIHAGANLYIVPSANLSGAKTASLTAYNPGLNGVWISIAVLTNETYKWQMPPAGKWLNPGDSVVCTFDVSAMSMDNINKLYIMISTDGYSGTLFFDNFTTDKGTVANFNNSSDLFKREGAGADAYVTTLAIVGGGNGTATKYAAKSVVSNSTKIAVSGKTLLVSSTNSGNLGLDVFDIQGHHIANLNKGLFASGTHSFDLNNLSKGLYIIRAAGSFGAVNNRFILK